MPLFERVKLAKRYDIAIMSSKGMSVTAARLLAEHVCADASIPLLVLHDFDSSGVIIKDTLENGTRRYSYARRPEVIDLGLSYEDIDGLPSEPNNSRISDQRLRQAGLGQAAVDFLHDQRVELNAMTSRQLVDFVEDKLKQHGIQKVIPSRETLVKTYQMYGASDRLEEAFDDVKKELEDESEDANPPITPPDDLEAQVKAKLEEKPNITWHHAIRLIVDPDAADGDEDDDDAGDLDDDDLSDIDE
jgi:hypothetical protein